MGYFSEEFQMKQFLIRLWKEDEAQDLTEYALLLVLLTLAAIGSLSTLANAINGVFSSVSTNLNSGT
jgi:Flp pilus assembly pilin Flp